MDNEEYVSVDDAAKVLGRHVSTVWRLIKQYDLPTFQRPMDRRTYLRPADIERLRGTFRPRGKGGATPTEASATYRRQEEPRPVQTFTAVVHREEPRPVQTFTISTEGSKRKE